MSKKYIKILFVVLMLITVFSLGGCKKNKCVPEKMTRINFDDYPTVHDIKDKIVLAYTPEGIKVTLADLYQWLDLFYSGRKQEILSNDKKVEEIVNKIMDQKIGVYLAKERGYDRDPEFLRKIELLKKNFEFRTEVNLVKKLVTIEVEKRINTSRRAVKEYYKKHWQDFDRYFVYIIKTECFPKSPESIKKAAYKKIQKAYAELKSGKPWKEVALKYNEGNPQWISEYGLIGWVHPGTRSKAFDEHLLKMKAGEFSEPFLTPQGYNIIYVKEVQKFNERYNYIKTVYYDKMVMKLNPIVKEKLLRPFKRMFNLKNLTYYLKGEMDKVKIEGENDTNTKTIKVKNNKDKK